MIVTLLVALCSAVVTFLMSLVMWRVGVKYKLYPKIRERDVHTTPTPRLGGIAMFFGVVLGPVLFGALSGAVGSCGGVVPVPAGWQRAGSWSSQATTRKRSWAWRLTVSTRSRRLLPGMSTTM